MTHDLKTWPDAFEALLSRDKTAEFRRDDRGFAVGDVLRLREYDPARDRYTGRAVYASITHVAKGRFGIPDGYAVLSLRRSGQTGGGPEP